MVNAGMRQAKKAGRGFAMARCFPPHPDLLPRGEISLKDTHCGPQFAHETATNLRTVSARAGFPRGRGKLRPGRARSPLLISISALNVLINAAERRTAAEAKCRLTRSTPQHTLFSLMIAIATVPGRASLPGAAFSPLP